MTITGSVTHYAYDHEQDQTKKHIYRSKCDE